jgi:hypothetical protein
MKRNILIPILLIAWVTWGTIFLLPLKLRLLKKSGGKINNDFLIELAKSGDAAAATLYRRTKIFVAVGIVGAFFVAFF